MLYWGVVRCILCCIGVWLGVYFVLLCIGLLEKAPAE